MFHVDREFSKMNEKQTKMDVFGPKSSKNDRFWAIIYLFTLKRKII